MTREEKDLLLIDLCAREPYGVKIHFEFSTVYSFTADIVAIYTNKDCIRIRPKDLNIETVVCIEDIKPYLRPMSSMTDEELEELNIVFNNCGTEYRIEAQDWLNEHMFDYRGLIPMGLALEATEDIYKTK